MTRHVLPQALLREFLDLGITRVSMGVQSFDASLLEACGRAHSLDDVYQAVEVLRQAGMDNFSIDLMRYLFLFSRVQTQIRRGWGRMCTRPLLMMAFVCVADRGLTKRFFLCFER